MAQSRSRSKTTKESPDAQELLLEELREIHSAESQLTRALPRLAKAIDSVRFKELIETRQSQGERIIQELDEAFDGMGVSPGRKKNVAAEGLINDAREHAQEIVDGPARDAVLIGALQKTEHYCIAAWGTARSMAEATGQKQVAKIMDRALKEGGKLDEDLTRLAEGEITPALLAGAEPGEEGEGSRSRRAEHRAPA